MFYYSENWNHISEILHAIFYLRTSFSEDKYFGWNILLWMSSFCNLYRLWKRWDEWDFMSNVISHILLKFAYFPKINFSIKKLVYSIVIQLNFALHEILYKSGINFWYQHAFLDLNTHRLAKFKFSFLFEFHFYLKYVYSVYDRDLFLLLEDTDNSNDSNH